MQLALEGRVTEHHRWMLRLQREQLEFLEAKIVELESKIEEKITVYQEAIDLWVPLRTWEAGKLVG